MFERRLQVLLVLLAIVSFVLIARAFTVQVVGKSYWAEQNEKSARDETQIATTRGRILDVKGRELAIDQPCIDVCVDYRAILFEPVGGAPVSTTIDALRQRWLRGEARSRLKRRIENYVELPLTERKKLLDAEVDAVRHDIERMWQELARLSDKPIEEIDETRREIIRRVETQARIAWYKKYEKAQKSRSDGSRDPAWYAWLMGSGASEADIDKFELTVAEQGRSHPILRDIDNPLRIAIETRLSRFPGLTLRSSVRRYYPYGSGACHVIGRIAKVSPQDLVDDPKQDDKLVKYGSSDRIGTEGLERMLEQHLRGTRGIKTEAASGELVQDIAPIPGGDVKTTIDIELQTQIEQAFTHVLFNKDTSEVLPMTGAAVVVDVATGEVRALASWPTYDLNQFDEVYETLVKDEINRPLHNRATMTALEPGSTVKPIVGLGAITDGLFGVRDTIECTGFLVIGGKRYSFGRCWTMRSYNTGHHKSPWNAPHPNGFLTYADALERSCNVFFEELGDRLDIEGLSNWFGKFGLGRPTGIGLPEARGRIPKDFDGPMSRRRATAWFGAIGQDQVAATPIQMANVAATIARSGVWMKPSLTPGPGDERVDLKLNREALEQARIGMINVVNGPAGTGTVPRMERVLVAGKTGSAQSAPLRIPQRDSTGKPIRDDKGRVVYDTIALGTKANPNPRVPWYRGIGDAESDVPSHAWMIGFAPANNPKIAYAVMVEYGGGGGTAAGSVVKQLLEACLEHGYLPAR